jgi:hypothetical protein
LRPFSTRRSQPNPRADRRRKRWPGTGDANVLGNGVCRVAPTTLREAKPKAAAVPGATTADTDRGGRRAQKPSRSMPLTDSLAARSPSSATRRAGRPPTKINRGADRAVEKARGPVGRGDATTPAAGTRLRRVGNPTSAVGRHRSRPGHVARRDEQTRVLNQTAPHSPSRACRNCCPRNRHARSTAGRPLRRRRERPQGWTRRVLHAWVTRWSAVVVNAEAGWSVVGSPGQRDQGRRALKGPRTSREAPGRACRGMRSRGGKRRPGR